MTTDISCIPRLCHKFLCDITSIIITVRTEQQLTHSKKQQKWNNDPSAGHSNLFGQVYLWCIHKFV